jgi:pimeloyl-ACP methyl ester carboxylesterase
MCFGDRANSTDLESIRRADGRLRKVMFSSMMHGACADERRLVETSPVPLAVVVGDQDPFFRMGYLEGIDYRALWEGKCQVIPYHGHDVFRAAPELFNPLLMRFATSAAEPRQITLRHLGAESIEPKRPRRPTAQG